MKTRSQFASARCPRSAVANEFATAYQSECRPKGPYGARHQAHDQARRMNPARPYQSECRPKGPYGALILASVLAWSPAGLAQNGEPPAPDQAPLTLDELLGLDSDESESSAAEQARRDNEQELERRLAAGEIGDVFELALEKMALSALLLDVKMQAGLGTQRVQLDVLANLDDLIDKAKQMQSQKSSSSSSQSQPDQSLPKPGSRQTGSSDASRQASASQSGQATDPPPRQEGDLGTILEESDTEWGHLPSRFREMLLQGRNEKFSSLYERLTREYYKRLAEER